VVQDADRVRALEKDRVVEAAEAEVAAAAEWAAPGRARNPAGTAFAQTAARRFPTNPVFPAIR